MPIAEPQVLAQRLAAMRSVVLRDNAAQLSDLIRKVADSLRGKFPLATDDAIYTAVESAFLPLTAVECEKGKRGA